MNNDYRLAANRVITVFMDCLYRDGEDTSDHVRVEGIMTNVGFHPGRLKAHAPEIMDMLMQLPEQFRQSSGGGWTFLNACNDRHGTQWADLHRTMEQLVLLGIGIGKVKFQMPRDMWDMFPGGMPYFMILDKEVR
jgi:hypothetical protein